MQQMEKLSCEDLEVCENFQIREIRKVRQKKSFTLPTPTTNATNGASLNVSLVSIQKVIFINYFMETSNEKCFYLLFNHTEFSFRQSKFYKIR
jgi:hypothetical protein